MRAPAAGAVVDRRRTVSAYRAEAPTVLHVMECFAGGTERHLIDLVRCVEDFKHAVAVPSSHHGKSTAAAVACLEEAGALVERVEMTRAHAVYPHARALADLRRLIRRIHPNILHGHSSIGGVMARVASAGIAIPIVYTPNGASRFRWAVVVERALRGRADRVIAVSHSEGEYALRQRLATADRLVVIPNGIDLEPPPALEEPLRSRLGLDLDVPLVGTVGRLAWQKAPEVFVAACAVVHEHVPDAHFVLIGAGVLRRRVEELVAAADLWSRFHLIPSLPNAAAALAELDVYALASRFEGGPYTVLEAMRAGAPVVVTDVAGNRDLVDDGMNGLVVAPEAPEQLGEAIVALIIDRQLRTSLVRRGRATVASYDVREMAKATAAVYRELCASGAEAGEDLGVRAHAPLPGELFDPFKPAGRVLAPETAVVE